MAPELSLVKILISESSLRILGDPPPFLAIQKLLKHCGVNYLERLHLPLTWVVQRLFRFVYQDLILQSPQLLPLQWIVPRHRLPIDSFGEVLLLFNHLYQLDILGRGPECVVADPVLVLASWEAGLLIPEVVISDAFVAVVKGQREVPLPYIELAVHFIFVQVGAGVDRDDAGCLLHVVPSLRLAARRFRWVCRNKTGLLA